MVLLIVLMLPRRTSRCPVVFPAMQPAGASHVSPPANGLRNRPVDSIPLNPPALSRAAKGTPRSKERRSRSRHPSGAPEPAPDKEKDRTATWRSGPNRKGIPGAKHPGDRDLILSRRRGRTSRHRSAAPGRAKRRRPPDCRDRSPRRSTPANPKSIQSADRHRRARC